MRQSPASNVCSKLLRNIKNKSIFVSDALDTFHRRKSSRVTRNYPPKTTSCRFYMYSLCQALNRRKLNSTSTSIALRRHSSFMRTFSRSLNRPVAKLSTPPTPSSKKCVQQQPSSPRVIITLINELWWKLEKTRSLSSLTRLSCGKSKIVAILRTNRTIKRLSARQQEEYDNATRCYICRHEFVEREAKGPKVRDHDHITGWFINAAHRQCNLERPICFTIPVFVHNFRGYDAHLIVQEFGKRPDREIKMIGQNMEKYLQVECSTNMVFRDSFRFLPAFLEQLAASLAKVGRGYFQNLHDVVTDVYPEADVELFERKGVFCYDYLDSLARLYEPALPSR